MIYETIGNAVWLIKKSHTLFLLLPDDFRLWHERFAGDETKRKRVVCDFIAGMTDRYAAARYRELVGPVDLPEGF